MEILVTIFHIIIAFFLVLSVLLQSGKGGGLAGSLGGGMGASSVLGGRTAATFLVKATSILATIFLLSALVQSIVYQSSDEAPTTATERMLQQGAAPPMAPISESPGFLEEPVVTEGAGEAVSTEAVDEAAPAVEGAAGEAETEGAVE